MLFWLLVAIVILLSFRQMMMSPSEHAQIVAVTAVVPVKQQTKKEAAAEIKHQARAQKQAQAENERQEQVAREAEEAANRPDLEVVDHKWDSEDDVRYAVGTVRNNTDHCYGYVQVEVNLYDEDHTQVGSTLANCNNLEPHGKWNFKALIFEKSATRFKIKDVTGF